MAAKKRKPESKPTRMPVKKPKKKAPTLPGKMELDPTDAVNPTGRGKTTGKKHGSTPVTGSHGDVWKVEEFERSGSVGRAAHASVSNRRRGG